MLRDLIILLIAAHFELGSWWGLIKEQNLYS